MHDGTLNQKTGMCRKSQMQRYLKKWFTNTPLCPTKTYAKVTTKSTTHDQPSDDDMDSINAKLRDAYELCEVDE